MWLSPLQSRLKYILNLGSICSLKEDFTWTHWINMSGVPWYHSRLMKGDISIEAVIFSLGFLTFRACLYLFCHI